MKPDEKLLLQRMVEQGEAMSPSAWEIAQSIGMAYKRARFILRDKWARKDWYDYGIAWRVGWLNSRLIKQIKAELESSAVLEDIK